MKRGRFWKAMQFQPHRLKIFWFLLGNDMFYTSFLMHTLFSTYLYVLEFALLMDPSPVNILPLKCWTMMEVQSWKPKSMQLVMTIARKREILLSKTLT